MEEKEINVCGAPVTFTTKKEPPYNPLRRPKISYKKPIILALIYLVILIICVLLTHNCQTYRSVAVCVFWSMICLIAFGKKAAIWLVHFYQNKASNKTRLKCVFEPSCSEYMILSIKKYGLIIGVFKGIKRLFRCHPPNGGKDYP